VAYPAGLHVVDHAPRQHGAERDPVVVLVHGALDRAESFGRVVRRLADHTVVTYDRRGYQRSRVAGPPPGFAGHVEDLLGIAEEAARVHGSGPPVIVGHSFGGTVAVGAAVAAPERFGAVGAYEPPMPWLGFHRAGPGSRGRWPEVAEDPADEAERFFIRMVSQSAWNRLTPSQRAGRRADGPALVADLSSLLSTEPPFDVRALRLPSVFGRGGPDTQPHHRDTVGWLAAELPGAHLHEVAEAAHGAHLSHPDAFASLVRATIRLARQAAGRPPEKRQQERPVQNGRRTTH